jgi:SAM-dependent methyltransferase
VNVDGSPPRFAEQGNATASSTPARYDGYADWYDKALAAVLDEEYLFLAELVRAGRQGRCLDVACGTGRYTATLEAAGYRVFGIDYSSDQLRVASTRRPALARGDVSRLSVLTGSVELVFGAYFHTDIEGLSGCDRRGREVPRARRSVHLHRTAPVLHRAVRGPRR